MQAKKEENGKMGARIQKARLAAGLTQEKFGELVGLSAKNISMIECGVSGISVPTLRRICRVLSISSDDILFGPAQQNSVQALAHRLEHLQASQFELTQDIFNCLLETIFYKGIMPSEKILDLPVDCNFLTGSVNL